MLQTRVGYAGGSQRSPTYHSIGGHAEAVRVTFDPNVLSFEDLLGHFYSKAGDSGSTTGQYRSQTFLVSGDQAEAIRSLANGSRIPIAEPGSAMATFWSAEDYHQKYRLRRNARVVTGLADVLGPRWDEHVWATKLNAVGERGFDIKPWLAEMPEFVRDAFRRSA